MVDYSNLLYNDCRGPERIHPCSKRVRPHSVCIHNSAEYTIRERLFSCITLFLSPGIRWNIPPAAC